MNNFYLFLRLFQLMLWIAFNFIFTTFRKLVWEITGTASVLRNSPKNPDSKTSAHVMNIHGRFKFCDYVMNASERDFLLSHERFEPPEYVLQDHITLYTVSNKKAIFVETIPGCKVWDTKHHPSFFMPAQFHAAVKVVTMPIESLQYLADKIGDPKGKLIFLSNCARCGSTLLTQMFEATEKILAFGEPNCLSFLAKAHEIQNTSGNKENQEKFESFVRSTIRLLCKPTESGQEIGYMIKIISPSMTSTPLLMKLFPKSYHFYMYRNPVKVAQSIFRMSCSLYSLKFIYFFGRNSAFRLALCMSAVGFPSSLYRIKLKHILSIGVLNWSTLLKQYVDFRKSNLKIVAVRYEDLIQHAAEARRKIFKYCELPIELAEKAGEALKWDSQKGTPIAQEVLQKFPTLPCTGEIKIECEQVMAKYGFPGIDEEYIADGTITYPSYQFIE